MNIENDTNKPIEILVVEDNPGDVKLFLEKFKEFKVLANYHVVTNGVEALKFLFKEDKYNNAPKPDLLVLDLYLPKKSGLEVLSEMAEDKDLMNVPVVIFTSSGNRKDILENCKNIHCIFINKPENLDDYDVVIKTLEKFWISIS